MSGPREKDPNEIGALWLKTSANGKDYLSGTINGVSVVCFKNHKQHDKQPDWRVLKSQPRDQRPAASERLDTREPAERRSSRVDDIDSDVPF